MSTAIFVQNFSVGNQLSNTAIGTTATAAVSLGNVANLPDVMVVNNGSVGVQLALGTSGVVAVNTAGAAGTNQIYIPAGAVMIVALNRNTYYSVITDGGTGSLILHTGTGS